MKTTVDDYVGNRNGTNLQTSLALDDSGHLHVSYAPPWFSILRYATNASGAWVIETVDDFGETGQYSSLGVDHQGVVTVAYTDFTNNRVKLAQRGSTGWRRYDMAQGDGSSVFVDNYGQAHLAVSDRETLRYIKNVAGELRAESVRLVKPY